MAGRPAQQQPFNTTNGLTATPSKYAAQPPPPSQPPMGYTYEAFQTPSIPTRAPSMSSAARPMSLAPSPSTPSRSRDYVTDADTTMEDADPYNRAKYSVKTNHYARPSSQYFPTEESTAARRYSPKNALSPSAPYNANSTSPTKSHNSYAFPPGPNSNHHFNHHHNRSPTRGSNYTSPPQSYQSPPCKWIPSGPVSLAFPASLSLSCGCWANLAFLALSLLHAAASHPPRLPPLLSAEMSPEQYYPPSAGSQLSAPFGAYDGRSPRSASISRGGGGGSQHHHQPPAPGRGPVPKFQKVKSIQDLQPHSHSQPPYRRANPEGGFISVSSLSGTSLSFVGSRSSLKNLSSTATPSIDDPPAGFLSDMQPGLQL